jgi:hypothetical protein
MIATDILVDDNGDRLIANGDFVVGPSDAQHMQHLLWATPGTYKQNPQMGVGIFNMINATTGPVDMNALRSRIVKNATADGMQVNNLELNNLTDMVIDVDRS